MDTFIHPIETAGAVAVALTALELVKYLIGKIGLRINGINHNLTMHDMSRDIGYLKNKISVLSDQTKEMYDWHSLIDPTTGLRPWMSGPYLISLQKELQGLREDVKKMSEDMREMTKVLREIFKDKTHTSAFDLLGQ